MTAPQTPSRVDEPGHRPQDPSSGSRADGSAPGLATTGALTCDDHHVFARDKFARLPRAEVWCDKTVGHTGAHSAVKGSMLLVWRRQDALPVAENPSHKSGETA